MDVRPSTGASKESFYIGPLDSISSHSNLNQWPSEGLQDKSKQPLVWEDVHHINGSTLHRVMSTGRERYSVMMSCRFPPSAVETTWERGSGLHMVHRFEFEGIMP
ncbi:hypothetical protein HYC85_027613 [Camellia sinensis]|uniref:Isopenicillin N synthase-like Fe(2+) 2OG dioxygenase domain-containing protein n=1 Tax=Camellia sinensis TaxID=4442 RepID=A0A7J7GAR7_CAMSI|nr:hypothetical protein HYC85_027613 [Camellia sinensis]